MRGEMHRERMKEKRGRGSFLTECDEESLKSRDPQSFMFTSARTLAGVVGKERKMGTRVDETK